MLILFALLLAAVMLFSSCDLLRREEPETPAEEPDPAVDPVEEEPAEDDSAGGEQDTEVPHEHVWNEGKETKAPTCLEEGEKTFTCLLCGETRKEPLEKADHVWDEGVETLTEEGVKTFTCTVCGETKTEAIIGSNMSDGTGGGGGSSGGGGTSGGGGSSGGSGSSGGGSGSSGGSSGGGSSSGSSLGGDILEPDMQNGSALGDNILEPDMKGTND